MERSMFEIEVRGIGMDPLVIHKWASNGDEAHEIGEAIGKTSEVHGPIVIVKDAVKKTYTAISQVLLGGYEDEEGEQITRGDRVGAYDPNHLRKVLMAIVQAKYEGEAELLGFSYEESIQESEDEEEKKVKKERERGSCSMKGNGTVKFFNDARGFGFIIPDEPGPDVFVHYKTLKIKGWKTLREGQRVEYEAEAVYDEDGSERVRATEVTV